MSGSNFRQIFTLSDDELTRVSRNLAVAFSQDPLAHALLGEWPSDRSDLAVDFFKAHISAGLSDGAVYAVGEDIPALLVAFGPGKEMNDQSPEWKDVISRIPGVNRHWQLNEFKVKYENFIEQAYGKDCQHDSWYIILLGVEISNQKRGLGSMLLREMQHVAEQDQVSLCWQTTTAPEFYEALGFKAVGEVGYLSRSETITQRAYISRPSP
ncbi:hypothetical protein K435DRAFT_872030 [Dendrothele bispora CBS 962.96]|uniref:N-acetyltransferase domain-containing protein n=1 Tax=Dendrothele bispora (strain CBS 962.96) TaxID=1314807 RepID=A0A4S8L2M8_DENBC|nr:hypothetical protein K435DRAFT_872030 [Dendrothele bispora CBS 962.96]